MRIIFLLLISVFSTSIFAQNCIIYAEQAWRTDPIEHTELFNSLKNPSSGFWFYSENKCKNIDSKKIWIFYTWSNHDVRGLKRKDTPTAEIAQVKMGNYCTKNGEFIFNGKNQAYHLALINELIFDGYVFPDDFGLPECQ